MRLALMIVLFSSALSAQPPSQSDLIRLTGELRSAIEGDRLTPAADLADKLDDGIKAQQRAWLIRDADQQVEDILKWLPVNTESLWVNQDPFTIKAHESLRLLSGRAPQLYSVDRLSALNDGKFYRLLSGQTVRFVVAATWNNTFSQTIQIPALAPRQDVAYFFFFSEPVDFGSQDEYIEERPVWRAVAKILDAQAPFRPGVEPPQREDENWLALAQPDLLVLTSTKELLAGILQRTVHGSQTRALPSTVTEWNQVDRHASFWGLRHYTDQSRPKPNERGFKSATLPQPDGGAVGVAVNFDSAHQRLEIRYMSDAPLTRTGDLDVTRPDFQVDQPQAGVWRLVSDVKARGDYPVHFAFAMLGFGNYR
jgi:hypothetical protein